MIVKYVVVIFMYLCTIITRNVIHSSRGTIDNNSQYVNLWQVSVYVSETSVLRISTKPHPTPVCGYSHLFQTKACSAPGNNPLAWPIDINWSLRQRLRCTLWLWQRSGTLIQVRMISNKSHSCSCTSIFTRECSNICRNWPMLFRMSVYS